MSLGNISMGSIPNLMTRDFAQLPALHAGQKLDAEVVALAENAVVLRVPGGGIVRAEISFGVPLEKGDQLSLVIVQNSGGQAVMKAVSVNGQDVQAQASPLEQLLLRAGIAATPRHVQAARALQNLMLAVTPKIIQGMTAALERFPGLEVQTAALMAALDMPIHSQSIQTVQAWLSGGGDLEAALHALLLQNEGQVFELPSQAAAPVQTADMVPGMQTSLQNEVRQPAEAVPVLVAPQDQAPQGETAPAQGTVQMAASALLPAVNAQTSEGALPMLAQVPSQGVLPRAQAVQPSAAPQDAEGMIAQSVERQAVEQVISQHMQAAQISVIRPQGAAAETMQAPIQATGPQPEQAPLPAAGQADRPTNPAAPLSATPVQDAAPAAMAAPPRDEVVRLLRGVFTPLQGEGSPDGQRLWQGANELEQNLAKLQLVLEGEGRGNPALLRLERAAEQTRLTAQLDTMAYAQLPYVFDKRPYIANVYVMQKEPRKKLDQSSATILLSLQTQHMGLLEAVIRVRETKLQVQFRLDKPRLQAYVRGAEPMLRALSAQAGYQLEGMSVSAVQEKITPLTAHRIAEAASHTSRIGLDLSI